MERWRDWSDTDTEIGIGVEAEAGIEDAGRVGGRFDLVGALLWVLWVLWILWVG